ncbi:MAG TPA: tetratricopeptide repeat protein [Terriglobales bacterium]|nr:tetratricopeptide repeat protein [Terriglobales bacterium]
MRSRIYLPILALLSTLASGQSMSPDALYERAINAITGVAETQNQQAAIDYFHRSSDLGYGPAQIALGYYYEMGIVPGNQGQASVDLYKKAAAQGDPLAAWLAGRRYFLGNGVPQDLEAAKKWLKMAADQKSAYGAYYYGRLMVERDPAKATPFFKLAADQGLPQAQYFYARALKDGQGVAQDKLNAYVWFMIAADAGYEAAGDSLDHMRGAGLVNVDDINQAQAKAKDLEQVVIRAVNARGCSGWDGEFAELPSPPPPSLQRFCH